MSGEVPVCAPVIEYIQMYEIRVIRVYGVIINNDDTLLIKAMELTDNEVICVDFDGVSSADIQNIINHIPSTEDKNDVTSQGVEHLVCGAYYPEVLQSITSHCWYVFKKEYGLFDEDCSKAAIRATSAFFQNRPFFPEDTSTISKDNIADFMDEYFRNIRNELLKHIIFGED